MLVSVVKMATALEECAAEEQRSVVHFLGAKGLCTTIFIKKCFLLMVGSVCSVKRFTTGPRNSLKDVRKLADGLPGAEVAETTSVLRVSTHWLSDGASVSVLEDISRNNFLLGSNITCFTFCINL
jgi:hypothetical protein